MKTGIGWEAGIRTPITWSRATCPTVERPPNPGRGPVGRATASLRTGNYHYTGPAEGRATPGSPIVMSLAPGSAVGPYRIVGPLGAGGMGEVYRATDSRLKRDVALKVLPPEVAADPDRLSRFRREAELLAALNHPRIAHIYGLEESALVMELVEGPDLAERLARGPIPLAEALPIAKQIVEALEAAHACQIVHRDLKPANIKVTGSGLVKVLDFGLAKSLDRGPAEAAAPASTMTVDGTRVGTVLGTAGYMSPEQARGRPADKRADV